MFNKKAKRVIAVIGLLVMCVSTLASCQVGGTYAEKAGDQSVISVESKANGEVIPYEGDAPINWIPSGDRTAEGGPEAGGSSGGDDIGGGNENEGGDDIGGENNGGGDDDWGEEEEEVKYDERNKLKIIAYNLRCANDSAEYGGAKEISDRMPRFKEKVMDVYQPDVVGMSECVPAHITFLQSDYASTSYGDYQFHYTWRSSSNKETTPIMWNATKLEDLEHGTFWLSDTPDTESKATAWGAQHWRIVCWAKLKVKATGKIFLFFSTHFDFNDVAHVNSVKTIQKKATEMGAFSKYGFFFVGDCNMQPWKNGYNEVYKIGMADINYELTGDNGPGTCNGYHTDGAPEGESGGGTIDYIFYTPNKVHPLRYEVVDKMGSDGDWISDHRGLYAEAALL